MNNARSSLRVVTIQVVFVLTFLFLGVRLWGLQIGRSENYSSLADKNRFRLVAVDPPRGVFYDRNGKLLVRNVPRFSLSVVPSALPEDEKELDQLCHRLAVITGLPVSNKAQRAPLLGQAVSADTVQSSDGPEEGIADRIAKIQEQVDNVQLPPHSPVSLVSEITRDIAFLVEEEQGNLPGVLVDIEPERQYLFGELIANWLGYVGAIPESARGKYLAPSSGYSPQDQVGLTGVELTYEEDLRGRKGEKHIEVDAFEREMQTLATKPAEAGHSLVLSLDVDLQRAAEKALRTRMDMVKSKSGTVIAMNPQNGELLAMVNLPTYDNNLFSGGISVADYQRLITDPLSPLLNHAIGGEYPPGSTFKLVAASGGMESGVINERTEFTCQGILYLPNEYLPNDMSKAQPFYCWNPAGHGRVNLISALAYSCDIFFYQVGGGFKSFIGLGLDRLANYSRQFGFGEPTGIDLPGEASGLIPTERWKRETWDMNWVTGDTYNIAIGQGYILSTPLQLLNAFAAVANGGTLYRPQVVHKIVDADGNMVSETQPEVIRRVPVSAANLDAVRRGMRASTTWGTAGALDKALPMIHAAGKTGTAEYPGERDKEGRLPTHAWFGAFAPYENPEIAVVVFIAGGGQGATDGVPVAIEVLREYFKIPAPTPVPVRKP